MAKRDEETGVAPVATDGQPDPEQAAADHELAERRKLKEARERVEEAEVAGKRGAAIDDQAPGEEPQLEMYPQGSIQGDDKLTMKNIVPPAKARKTEAKMMSVPIPLRGGLVRYGDLIRLLVTVEAGKVEEVPDLLEPESGGRRTLMGVTDVQRFRPVMVEDASAMFSLDQVLDILESDFGIPRSADKIAEVFGPVTAEQRAAAAKAG